jgi:hypothetical protein
MDKRQSIIHYADAHVQCKNQLSVVSALSSHNDGGVPIQPWEETLRSNDTLSAKKASRNLSQTLPASPFSGEAVDRKDYTFKIREDRQTRNTIKSKLLGSAHSKLTSQYGFLKSKLDLQMRTQKQRQHEMQDNELQLEAQHQSNDPMTRTQDFHDTKKTATVSFDLTGNLDLNRTNMSSTQQPKTSETQDTSQLDEHSKGQLDKLNKIKDSIQSINLPGDQQRNEQRGSKSYHNIQIFGKPNVLVNNQGIDGVEYVNKDLNFMSVQELIKLAETHAEQKRAGQVMN